MAMLAGPRRKQKVINLRAKNSSWSNDSNKFGQKMLEKMGWSSGKGLGANEDGIVEHVVAKYKNDDKGLGYEDKNDQWTKHEDDFNALLANLSNSSTQEEKLHSGASLEVKSKTSKARVHYHKFTRAKDLSRYSEKDLANIFGKKSLKKKKEEPEVLKDDIKTTEQVFTEKGSMEDYFKNKMAAFNNKINLPNEKSDGEDKDYSFRGFANGSDEEETSAQQGFGFQGFSFYDSKKSSDKDDSVQDQEQLEKKKKKKNKIKEKKFENSSANENNELNEESSDVQVKQKQKKSKKRKHDDNTDINLDAENVCSNDSVQDTADESSKSKKKKKKESKLSHIETENTVEESSEVPKKKKKRKQIIE